MDDLDKMARELLAAEYELDGITYAPDCIRRELMLTRIEYRSVRAIRAALLTAPPGYVLVPVEPTPRMSAAGFCADEGHDPAGVYRAMLAAAPEVK